MRRKMYAQVVCADGFSMSVQASSTSYCSPRGDNAARYDHVEVGFPSEHEVLLMPWVEDHDNPCSTVYGYVPVQTVTNVIAKHGGMYTGEVPPGVHALKCSGR